MNTLVPTRLRRSLSGFTMIEMIGVLAIIAILAVIVVPKVFSTIAGSRVTSAVASVNAMRTAVTEFGGRFGTLPLTNNNSRIDDLLMTANMLENRFVVKIGTQPGSTLVAGATWANTTGTWVAAGGSNQNGQSRLICATSTTAAPSTVAGTNFRLNGTSDLPAGSRVVAAVIVGITIAEARDLSLRIDGDSLSTPPATPAVADNAGKVVYNAPNGAGVTTAYIYLAHQ
ncbi:MAG: prepilin-type N-terminal cleavage/methylation domain-containing protein [Opitutaceae bacterium]|nr:prepilin-type N-terminal cleavage/methylation domain-containing protein [Opitutaceae bacterium]